MSLTSAQIVTLACQIAKTPGMTAMAGQMLNVVLQELAQTYDFDLARGTYNFNFNTGLATTSTYPNIQPGGGPYPLPSDYLRADLGDVMWFLLGVPYPMIPIDLSEYDRMVQQAGLQSYPYLFATDMSQSPPVAVVWPPPSGNYPVMVRYRKQQADITSPESSSTVPWFSDQNYLITRTAGEMMKITDDDRAPRFLGEGPDGAQGILNRYLKMHNDHSNRAYRVTLDRRRFGTQFSVLRNTKQVGW